MVRAVDELGELSTLTDITWAVLRERFDEPQVLDLIFTTGSYQLLAVAVNALGVRAEEPGEGAQPRPR